MLIRLHSESRTTSPIRAFSSADFNRETSVENSGGDGRSFGFKEGERAERGNIGGEVGSVGVIGSILDFARMDLGFGGATSGPAHSPATSQSIETTLAAANSTGLTVDPHS